MSAWTAIAAAALAVVTMVDAEWIEAVFGVDPDGGSGALEWGLALGLGIVAAASALVSRWSRRAAVAHAPDSCGHASSAPVTTEIPVWGA